MVARLVIDWTQMPTYNTIMSVAAGSALMSLVYFARALGREREVDLESWALAFAVPGFILTVTAMHIRGVSLARGNVHVRPLAIGAVQEVVGFVWWLSGLGFFLFGALNFFTHIGLIIHTMPGQGA